MKITAWDTKRKQYIPQEEFAVTGDGKLLIHLNESILLYPAGTPSGKYSECSYMPTETIVLKLEEE